MKYTRTMKYQVKYWATDWPVDRGMLHMAERCRMILPPENWVGYMIMKERALNLQKAWLKELGSEIDRFLKLTGLGVQTAGGRGEPLPTRRYLWMEGRLFCPDSESKRWEGELLPRRPDSREKGNKTTGSWVWTMEGKVGSAHREDRTAARKCSGLAPWSKARKDGGLLETGPPSSWAESSAAAGR